MRAQNNKNAADKYLFASITCCILLLVGGWLLERRAVTLRQETAENILLLQQALPNFNNQSSDRLTREIGDVKTRLLGLSALFDPKYKWIKKNYDVSIYFVEELGNVKQALKQKAEDKKLPLPDLGFKEKLPSEQEADYLLSQLYGLREVVAKGLDYGIAFQSVNPLGVEEKTGIDGVKTVKSRLQLRCPAETMIEFIIKLNEIVPKVCFNSLSLTLKDSSYDIDATLEQVSIDMDLSGMPEIKTAAQIQEITGNQDVDFVRTLRSNNPFFVPSAPAVPPEAAAESPKPKTPPVRFIYRGQATLKSKPVVVIEDLLTQETVFVGLNEKIGDFTLINFSDSQITLHAADTGKELVIKREGE
jgi:hypothetical protein